MKLIIMLPTLVLLASKGRQAKEEDFSEINEEYAVYKEPQKPQV